MLGVFGFGRVLGSINPFNNVSSPVDSWFQKFSWSPCSECGIWKSMHWFFTILRPFWGKINALKYIVLSYTAAALYNFSCLQKYQCIIMHNYHFWPCTLIYIEINVLISIINQCTWSKVVIMHNYTLIFLSTRKFIQCSCNLAQYNVL